VVFWAPCAACIRPNRRWPAGCAFASWGASSRPSWTPTKGPRRSASSGPATCRTTRSPRALAASHLALCLLDEAPFVERIYPAKIFELMHLAKTFGLRVLTLSPPGVLADLVAAHRVGPLLGPRDEEGIAAFLAAELRAFVAGTRPTAPAPVDVERYDRRVTAGQFAQVMALARDRARC
jgi:hypothetical protein